MKKYRAIGIVLAILLLLTTSLTTLTANNEEEWKIDKYFFIHPRKSPPEPFFMVVVGENAAKSDYKAAILVVDTVLELYGWDEKFDPNFFIVNDSEVLTLPIYLKRIIIGGPGPTVGDGKKAHTCNKITKRLVDEGRSKINWFESNGTYEYLPWNISDTGMDTVIIAGKDREATMKAVKMFIKDLKKNS